MRIRFLGREARPLRSAELLQFNEQCLARPGVALEGAFLVETDLLGDTPASDDGLADGKGRKRKGVARRVAELQHPSILASPRKHGVDVFINSNPMALQPLGVVKCR